jgi:tetratricopeptide (TPR) repeat protein
MNCSWIRLILVTGLALSAQAQTGTNPPSTNTIFPPPASLNRPPSPPDAPLPNLDSVPSPPGTTKSKGRRALDRLTPNCADVVYHSCWSSPGPDPSARLPEAEREAQRNREAGEIYFKHRNYRGSESRFREALRYEPADPVATFELAQSLEKLGKSAEARDAYLAYLRILPNGPSAAGAKKAVKRLPSPSSSGNCKTL